MPHFLIRKFDPALHTAAKTLAAHKKVSLNKFILDAVLAHCLLTAHREGLTETVIKKIEKQTKKPARS
jgi:HicB family.